VTKTLVTEPWDRQRGEGLAAYAKFAAYRDLGPGRRLLDAAKICGVSEPRMRFLSAQHKWVDRCAAWDLDQRQKKLRLMLAEQEDMDKRQAQVGQGLQAVGMMSAMRHRERMMQDKEAALPVSDTTHMVEVGVKIERQAKGKPTEIIEQQHGVAPRTLEQAFRLINESRNGHHDGNGDADPGNGTGDELGEHGPRVLAPPPEPA